MRAYVGTFLKADGSKRKMKFARLSDLPSDYLRDKIKGSRKPFKQAPGHELVWDLESKAFRIFNHSTIQGHLSAIEFDENQLS